MEMVGNEDIQFLGGDTGCLHGFEGLGCDVGGGPGKFPLEDHFATVSSAELLALCVTGEEGTHAGRLSGDFSALEGINEVGKIFLKGLPISTCQERESLMAISHADARLT